MNNPILPPAVIGIIGGGQLGMMIIREAQRMGYRSIVWDPDAECPASRLADETITAPFNDQAAAKRLAEQADVITYEFEHISPEIVEWLEQSKHVYPGSAILRSTQHRRLEKEELKRKGFPVVEYQPVLGKEGLWPCIELIGLPVVLKTSTAGYDGKGQTVLRTKEEVREFLDLSKELAGECVIEKFIDLEYELSVVAVRGRDGFVTTFPVCENTHRDNILHTTIVPARISENIQRDAVSLARSVMKAFNIVGVLCVEMFVTKEGKVLVNELAPRPHNSGHFSLDACDYSQFEAVIRAICGLPLHQPRLLKPCAMVNLLGKHLAVLAVNKLMMAAGIKLHLYGKKRLEPKRKMGHVTILGDRVAEVERTLAFVTELIGESEQPSVKKKSYANATPVS